MLFFLRLYLARGRTALPSVRLINFVHRSERTLRQVYRIAKFADL